MAPASMVIGCVVLSCMAPNVPVPSPKPSIMTFVPVGMMSGALMVMPAGSIVSPGAAMLIAACKAASVLALSFTVLPGTMVVLAPRVPSLIAVVDALTGVPVMPSSVPPESVESDVVSCAAFCPAPIVELKVSLLVPLPLT